MNPLADSVFADIAQHPQRATLSNELHARPFVAVESPSDIFSFAFITGEGGDAVERSRLEAFCRARGGAMPARDAKQFNADYGDFIFRWERHTEFTVYSASLANPRNQPFSCQVPQPLLEWLTEANGELLDAAHLSIIHDAAPNDNVDALWPFDNRDVASSRIAGDNAKIWCDLRIRRHLNHILLLNNAMDPETLGRVAQRLLEISTYRSIAMLALPEVARLKPQLAQIELELSHLLYRLKNAATCDAKTNSIDGNRALLHEVSALSAHVQELSSANYRFSASRAYRTLVANRIHSLREQKRTGKQTLSRFLERRFNPAMRTSEAVAARLASVEARVARAVDLLSTRVNLAQEQQNQRLLESMNRRAKMQLRLQETVEGLSIAAITYYFVGLVGYMAKAAKTLNFSIQPELIQGLSIVPIAVLVGLNVKRVRKKLNAESLKD